jgi:hypothetical protein
LSFTKKILTFVKKIKMSLSNIVIPKMSLTKEQKNNYFKGSGYEDEELNFIDEKPWILYLDDNETRLFFQQGATKELRLSLKKQILQKLNKIKWNY